MFTEEERKLYRVEFASYAKRHYLKNYERKYGRAWEVTKRALVAQFERIENLVNNKRTNTPIHRSADERYWLIKHEFAVAGTKQSPKGSGNRAIVCVDREERVVFVLMVYHKSDLGAGGHAETATWECRVREHCGEYLAWLERKNH